MPGEWNAETIFDVFGNETARRILALSSVEPLAASDLAERLDVSEPTVYRRVNALLDLDLLAERVRIDEDGNRYQVYETQLEHVGIAVEDGAFRVDLSLAHDPFEDADPRDG